MRNLTLIAMVLCAIGICISLHLRHWDAASWAACSLVWSTLCYRQAKLYEALRESSRRLGQAIAVSIGKE